MTADSESSNASASCRYFPGNVIVAVRSPSERIREFTVKAPLIAAHHRPGHFVIVRIDKNGERIPLTIADSDPKQGTITLVVQAVGASTDKICRLQPGESFLDLSGPLGAATEIANFGHVVLIGGGVGTAVTYPQAKALKQAGCRVTAIIGGRSREFVILERELRKICDAVLPCTDDGSYGYHGLVTGQLRDLIDGGTRIDRVITAGPLLMMKAVASVTRSSSIPTIASLVTIMVDGTGMCGGCRVTVAGELRFACVHGPEFDAHQVDFDELTNRLRAYRVHEKVAFVRERKESTHVCRLEPVLAKKKIEESRSGYAARSHQVS